MRTWIIGCIAIVVSAAGCGKDEANGDPCEGANCADVRVDPNNTTPDGGTSNDPNSDPNNDPMDMGDGEDLAQPADMNNGADMAGCERTPSPADGPRKVVVGLPFTGTMYEVFDLSETGELTRPNVTFAMGEGQEGTIQFTPDGEVGFAVQDNGSLGVFRFNAAGQPEVLVAMHDPGFYVSGAIVDATGDNLYAWETGFRKLDDGTANGALYRLPINCATGLPGTAVEVFRGKLIRSAAWLSDTRIAVSAVDLLDDENPNDVHIVDLAGPTRIASESAFPDDEAIAAGFATTNDGLYMLVGDNSAFSGIANRIGVVGIQGEQLFAQQVFDIPDPVAIVTSPYNNAAIVLSTTDDNIYVLDYNPGAAVSAFSIREPLATTSPVLLPLSASMIDRGSLEGLVLITENVAVRRVQFAMDGSVTDLGLLELGGGVESIAGALGVTP